MITVNTLRKMKAEGRKIAMLTCYEASFAALMNQAGVDLLLVGDSLGMAVQGHRSTLPVSLADMCYHTAAVARGNDSAMIVADLPFGAYQQSREQAFAASAELMAAGAHMVKLEGGEWMADTTHFLQQRGIPVCAHIGLTPQSVNAFGGYRVQGKGDAAAQVLLNDARAHEAAGADIVLMECVPAELGKQVTQALACPTIGIGAGVDCDELSAPGAPAVGDCGAVRWMGTVASTACGRRPIGESASKFRAVDLCRCRPTGPAASSASAARNRRIATAARRRAAPR